MIGCPPLSLYIHIPWCVKKCPYCDFNSHESKHIPEKIYIDKLIEDFLSQRQYWEGKTLHSIFIGGGTPSLFSGKSINRLLKKISEHIIFNPDIEITLETNPGTAEYDNLSSYYDAGVNRLSFGMQSFNNKHLKKLGRIHSAEESYHAFNLARKSGFTNINIDLMHDLPEQTQVEALSDLTAAINLKPEHISWYQLTIEPNTVFFNSPPTQPNDIISGEIQNKGQTLLKQFGYCQYEVSAYSQDKKQSQHNLNYWQFGDYLAIGAGSHGKITQNHQSIIRYWRTRIPEHYLSKSQDFSSGKKIVSADDIAIEFLMNAFRLTDGFSEALFSLRTGLDISDISGNLKKAENLQLIVWQQEKITPTLLGQQYLNNLLSIFI